MRLRICDPRILAIDLRPRRFGYAVFEGRRMLLDWGICEYLSRGDDRGEIAGRRLAALLKICSPSAVVVKSERWESAEASPVDREAPVLRWMNEHILPVVSDYDRWLIDRKTPIYPFVAARAIRVVFH